MADNYLLTSNIPGDLLRSLDSEGNRRDRHIAESRSDMVDEDEGDNELDIDLEDSMVIRDDDDEDDSEIVYSRRHSNTSG